MTHLDEVGAVVDPALDRLEVRGRRVAHSELIVADLGLAEAYLLAGDPAAALPLLERSVRMWPTTDAPPEHLARAQVLLAQARSEAGAGTREGSGARKKTGRRN